MRSPPQPRTALSAKATALPRLGLATALPRLRHSSVPSHVRACADAPLTELAGRAKREISAQEEREREAEQTAKGMNEEGAANLARLEEVRRRRAEAAAKREEEAAEAAAAESARRGSAPEPELDQSVEVDDSSEKKKKKKSSKSKKGSKSDRPQVPIPPPKEMKAALIRLQVRHPPTRMRTRRICPRPALCPARVRMRFALGAVAGTRSHQLTQPPGAQGIAANDFLSRHNLKKASGNKLAKIKRTDFEKIMADFQETAAVSELEEFLDE
eukprot:COSAG02_NODE_7880_length_2806_cov_1.235685_3_plen_271_part_00